MENFYKSRFKSALKKLRYTLIGDSWKYKVKPIAWYNFHTWIWHTLVEDLRRYRHQKRSWSFTRFSGVLKPNLSRPLFIVGAPRSGTTFLGECIAELPEFSYHFEPVLTKAATRYIYEGRWENSFAAFFFKSVYSWLMRIHFDGDLRLAEKTPQVSLIISFLHQTFSDAKFIHIIRDGRDSAISLSKKLWYQNKMKDSGAKEPGGYPLGPKARFWVEQDRIHEFENTNDLHRCVWLWRRYIEIISEGLKGLPEKAYLELRYEDLVKHPTKEAIKILDFLEITNEESRGEFISYVEKFASPKSIGRWKEELSHSKLEELEAEAGSILRELNYY